MDIKQTAHDSKKWLDAHTAEIALCTGIAGSVSTVYLAAKGGVKAADALAQARFENDGELKTSEEIKVAWKYYVPAAASSALTVSSIVILYRVGASQAAASAAALAAAQQTFITYQDKVREKLGEEKEEEIRSEIAKDKLKENPPGDDVIVIASQDSLFLDAYSGRYFYSDYETVREAINEVNQEINRNSYAALNEYYEMLGLDPVQYGDEVGWNHDTGLLNAVFTPIRGPKNKPALSVVYDVAPVKGFDWFR